MTQVTIRMYIQVPTLDCGDKRLSESLDICKFLDTEFPDTPKLFNTSCEAGEPLHLFLIQSDTTQELVGRVHPSAMPCIDSSTFCR